MNGTSTNNKLGISTKILAVVSFIGLIIIISWVSVKLVNNLPNSFSSLASLSDSIDQTEVSQEEEYTKPETLTVTSNTTLINSGEEIVISWNTVEKTGSYIFTYSCNEGSNVSIVEENQTLRTVDCGTNYNIGNNNSLSLLVESEKNRYENISYTIAFLGTKDETSDAVGEASFTVINSNIQDFVVVEEPKVDVVTEISPKPQTPSPTAPTYEQKFVYEIPASNPNGKTDLSVKFVDTGMIIGKNFLPIQIEQNSTGAIQFEVKNYGTKTSEDWTFEVTLPTGGSYESKIQKPLKPNERAVITIGFSVSNKSSHTFRVTVDEDTDVNYTNDKFTKTVKFN
jgi:hypothetical protein